MARPVPRNYDRLSYFELYEARQQQLIQAMENAGFTPAQIRARLAAITRLRNRLRVRIRDEIRARALGDRYLPQLHVRRSQLHASVPAQRHELERLMGDRDKSFLDFLEQMTPFQLPDDEVINEWFSPKAF